MKLLGVDYGLRRIGLALSDGLTASPVGVVKDLAGVIRLVNEHSVEKIVIGLPAPHDHRVKEFGNRLQELTNLPIEYWDETLSTKEALSKMIAVGTTAKERRSKIDQLAAAIILQSFLDSRNEGIPL